MEHALMEGTLAVLHWLALPEVGLPAVFLIALVSATLLPMGSEPAVFGLVKLQPELFWPAVLVATAGNTVGGAISWWMGRGAQAALAQVQHARHPDQAGEAAEGLGVGAKQGVVHTKAMQWLTRFGARACLLSWLPVVGDPLCAVAGWLRLPFWPCVAYMAIGKAARYLVMTSALLWLV